MFARTARVGASGPSRPAAHDTVNGAGLLVARLGLEKSRASNATVGGGYTDAAVARLITGAARLAASGPLLEGTDNAINRALVHVADLSLAESRAGLAAMGDVGGDGTAAALASGAAGLGAARPGVEGADDTVDGAAVRVAGLGVGKGRAGVATVLGVSDHSAAAILAASAAGLAASGPTGPSRHDTVDGAGAFVTGLRLASDAATSTAMGGSTSDGARTGLAARGAGLAALGPGTPGGLDAVDGAGLSVAFAGSAKSSAGLATVGSSHVHTAALGLESGATSLGALVVVGPGTDDAIHRARLFIAVLALRQDLANNATVGGRNNNATAASSVAGTARLGACGPRLPLGKHAVLWAGIGVAGA